MILFNRIEFFLPHDANGKYDPEFVFGIDRDCGNECIVLDLGLFGVSLLRGDCVRPDRRWLVDFALDEDDLP